MVITTLDLGLCSVSQVTAVCSFMGLLDPYSELNVDGADKEEAGSYRNSLSETVPVWCLEPVVKHVQRTLG